MALVLLVVTPAWSAPCSVSLTASPGPEAIPDDADCPRNLTTFGHMAWQTFKMLVWPASNVMRGTADTARSLTDMTGPRVFETYKSDWEAFPKSAAAPLPWNETPQTATVCTNEPPIQLSPGTLVLASLNEFGNVLEAGFGGITHVLIAQNGKLVRYLAGFDQNEFNVIVANKLYDAINAPFPGGAQPTIAAAPSGTITVKSAWVEISGLTSDPATFYTRQALLQDPKTRKCEVATVGLVGLHIVHKTAASPQWIWASFEHVRNTPVHGQGPAAGFTFNDGSGIAMPSEPPLNTRNPMGPGWVVPPPYNVERRAPIAPDIASVNSSWQAALAGTVWAYYELAVVQWPGLPGEPHRNGLNALPTPPCFGHADTNLVNTTLETFLQPHIWCSDIVGPPPMTPRATCMGCHNGARSSDFVWAIKLNANTTGGPLSPVARRTGLEYLRSIMGNVRR